MLGTRCHMLAMYVVLESYLGMVCDYPQAYEGQPGFDFVKTVPTTWDRTIVLDGKPGAFVTIARQKNNNWYLGSISNNTSRTIAVNCSFLKEGNWEATIYSDAPDAAVDPNKLVVETRNVTSSEKMNIRLAGGGGTAIHFRKID